MLKKAREKKLINEIRKNMKNESLLKYLALNSIQSKAATLLMEDKISYDFYKKVFFTENGEHYTKKNYDYIMNY